MPISAISERTSRRSALRLRETATAGTTGLAPRFRLAHVNDLNGKRRGSARRQQDGTDLRVGDAFLASVGRLAFTDLGPLAQATSFRRPWTGAARTLSNSFSAFDNFRLCLARTRIIAETPLLGEHEIRFPAR